MSSDPAVTIPGLETLVRPLLDVLETALGLESVYLTEIDKEAGVQRVLLARNSASLQISEGLVVPWQDTLCKRALESGEMAVVDVPNCWGDSDAARELGLVTYVSAPVQVGDRLFGTLCAASRSRRPISAAGERVVRTISDLIAQHVEREQAQEQRHARATGAVEHLRADLLRQERRLNAVLNNATVSIFLMDERQHCVYMNPAAERLTGYALAETSGRALHEVIHHTRPDGTPYPRFECPIDRALPENNQQQGEDVFVHSDGSFYPVAYTASPIRDDETRIVGTVVEVRDIRRQKAVLDALSEANRAKDQFLAMLGHELRNPLSPITTALELLRMKGVEFRELEIINRQVIHLTRMVDDLLDVSRVTRGMIELHRAPIELADVVALSVETARPHLERARSVLELDVPSRGLVVHADDGRLAQALSNLLNNAVKFSPPGTRIRVHGWRDGARVWVAVHDEGCGIPDSLRARLFEPFVQGTQGMERALGGLGLGLSIAQSLVRLHDGELSLCVSDGAVGSKFTIDLPAHEAVAPVGAGPHPPSQTTTQPRRVLIVDDNVDAAESLREVLMSIGHEVLAVFDPASALRLAAQFEPDTAILDIGLPVMDGYELASRLRDLFGPAKAPRLLALTGYGLPADRARSAEVGFAEHLLKPVDLPTLIRAIDEIAEPVPPSP